MTDNKPEQGFVTDAIDGQMVFNDAHEGAEEGTTGTVTARVASLGIRNANGRTIMAGALGGPGVRTNVHISEWNHSSMPGLFSGSGEPPVGHGTIEESEDGKFLIATMKFFDEPKGDAVYGRLKAAGTAQQWSIGYLPNKTDNEGRISSVRVFEASPVLLGASPNTKTVQVDSETNEEQKPEPRDLRLDRLMRRYSKE